MGQDFGDVGKFRDYLWHGIMTVIGSMLMWVLYEVHQLDLDSAALKANHVTLEAHQKLESDLKTAMGNADNQLRLEILGKIEDLGRKIDERCGRK